MLARAHNRDTVPLRGPLRAWGGLRTSLVWISKPVVSHIEKEVISLSVFYYWIFAFLSLCSSFNPSLCRLSPFLLHCCCSKAMSLVGIYPNGTPALTEPSPGIKKNDRIIKNVKSLYCVNQVTCGPRCWKCWVHRIILRNFGSRIVNSFIAHVRPLSVENEELFKWNFTRL